MILCSLVNTVAINRIYCIVLVEYTPVSKKVLNVCVASVLRQSKWFACWVHMKLFCLSLYLDGSIHVRLFDAQHNLPGDSDTIEEVVDKSHVVYEGVNVAGAQHQQSGDQLNVVRVECEDRGHSKDKE